MNRVHSVVKYGVFALLAMCLTACDGGGSGSGSAHQNPLVVTVSAPEKVSAGDSVTMSAVTFGTDAQGVIEWKQVLGQGSTSVTIDNPNSPKVNFVAPSPLFNTERLVFTVTFKADGFTQQKEVEIIVNPEGMDVSAGEDFIIVGGQTVSLHATGRDDNAPANTAGTFSWAQVSGPDITIVDGDTANPRFDMPKGGGEFELSVTLTFDGGTTSATDWIIISGEPVPAPKIFAASASVGQSGSEIPLAIGIDAPGNALPAGATLQWQQVAGPHVTLKDPETMTPSFVAPNVTSPTDLTFRATLLTAENASSATYVSATVIVDSPLLIDAGPAREEKEGDTITLGVDIQQRNAGTLTYAWRQESGPSAQLNNADTRTPTVVLPTVPDNASPGDHVLVFEVAVSDGSVTAIDTLTVSVNKLRVIADITDGAAIQRGNVFYVGETAHLVAQLKNAKMPLSSVSWVQTAGPASTLGDSTAVTTTATLPSAGTYTFSVSIHDALGASESDKVSFTVQAKPTASVTPPPVSSPSSPLQVAASTGSNSARGTVFEGDIGVVAKVAASGGTSPYTYAWTQTGGQDISGSFQNATTDTLTFDAPTVTRSEAIQVQASVTDSAANNKTATLDYTIQDLPVGLGGMPKLNAFVGDTVTLAASAKGGKGGLSYTWTQDGTSPAAEAITDSSSAVAHFTASAKGTYSFTVNVTDALGNTASGKQVVDVAAVPTNAVPPVSPIHVFISPSAPFVEGQKGVVINASVIGASNSASYAWTVDSGTVLTTGDLTQDPNDPKRVSFDIPAVNADTHFSLKLTVTDGSTVREAFSSDYRIVNRNVAVHIAKAGTLAAVQNVGMNLTGNATGFMDPVTYAWSSTGGTLSATDTANVVFTPTDTTAQTITLTVTDSLGNTATDTFAVTAVTPFVLNSLSDHSEVWPADVPNSGYRFSPSVTGGVGPFTYSYSIDIATYNGKTATGSTVAASTVDAAWQPTLYVANVGSVTATPSNPLLRLTDAYFANNSSNLCARDAANTPCLSAVLTVHVHVTDTGTGVVRDGSFTQTYRAAKVSASDAVVNTGKPSNCGSVNWSALRGAWDADVKNGAPVKQWVCHGPPQICESVNVLQKCPVDKPYGVMELTNNGDASRTITLRCGDHDNDAYNEWFLKYSDDDKCTDFDTKLVYTQDFYCLVAWNIPGGYKACDSLPGNSGTYTP